MALAPLVMLVSDWNDWPNQAHALRFVLLLLPS
jgi:hypothetical protein